MSFQIVTLLILSVLCLSFSLSDTATCGSNGEPTVCTTPNSVQDRRTSRNQLTVATYNAEWLFWDNGNGGPSTRCPLDHTNGMCPWTDAAQLEEHLIAVALELRQVNADIVNLVEVQDCVVLQCLISAIGDPTYKPYLIKGTDTATDQNVGIITRIDPTSALFRSSARATIYSADSSCGSVPNSSYNSGVSKHYIARFNVPGIGTLSLIGLHFLAFPTTPDRCIRREAQATVINNIARSEASNGEVIILGDLNDYDADILDASNDVPTSRVSSFLKYSGSTRTMYNVLEGFSPRSKIYSSWWDQNKNCVVEPGELTLIDHLFVSPNLHTRTVSTSIYNTIRGCGSLQSDHYPIKVVIDTSATGATGNNTKTVELIQLNKEN